MDMCFRKYIVFLVFLFSCVEFNTANRPCGIPPCSQTPPTKTELKPKDLKPLCFPKSFMFGVATAAFQIEGAWNEGGKTESIWDRYIHQYSCRVADGQNADIACDSYHQYKNDVKALKALNVNFYRFSISWPRILPEGFSNEINEAGIMYYTSLLDALDAEKIEPLITMYHWDLPQALEDLGGWTNPAMADYFTDYARVLFKNFGHRVKGWITFNEPLTFCGFGYGGSDAPGGRSSGIKSYLCAHNVLRAHGMVYRMFQEEFKDKCDVNIGIALDITWIEPNSTSKEDIEAAETALQFQFGWFANPIFSAQGDYPQVMRTKIDLLSEKQNFPRSRLPAFTPEEVEMIRGAWDFLGVNHYTSRMASKGNAVLAVEPSYSDDVNVTLCVDPNWPCTNSTWLRVVPWGFRKALNWITKTYNNPLMAITENGIPSAWGLDDRDRLTFIHDYLAALHAAINEDGCNVVGYTYWSLMDNFEWMRGYTERYGLYEVNFYSTQRDRTPRKSAAYYGRIAKSKCLPPIPAPYEKVPEDDNKYSKGKMPDKGARPLDDFPQPSPDPKED